MFAFHAPEAGEGVAGGELGGVARVNAGDEWIEAVVHQFGAEVGAHEVAEGKIGGARAAAVK